MSAGEAGRKWNTEAVRSRFLNNGTLTIELCFYDPIDDDRFGGEYRHEAPRGPTVFFGAKSANEREQYPNQSEVTEFGQVIDDAISGLGAAETIEEFIDAFIEPVDHAQLWGRFGLFDACHG